MGIITKIFGSHSEHEIKRIRPIVNKINSYEGEFEKLSDDELRAKTNYFKERLSKGDTLDDIMPEAYAAVREAAKRTLKQRAFDVQLMGAIILHQGRIAEMKTGEGKTLTSTFPIYLNALEGKGVHVVTVNDYLANRDSHWMGQVYKMLGLSVGCILNSMQPEERRAAYNCDITYGTNNEFGFDYLRDNMVVYMKDLVQRGLHYAIIDEVDSVLIDEARTPLIISGQSGKSTDLYRVCDIFVRQLKRGEAKELTKMDAIMKVEQEETGDFIYNEKEKNVVLTAQGVEKAERFFAIDNLADIENTEIQHNITLALKAHNVMHRDQDYVVKDDEVLIVDDFTGRIMPGRRFSDGLHQAIEAKEGVKVKRESKTLATITFQNFFNKYEKKCGMTGTALTEEQEFRDIYGMDVVEVPTNLPVARVDEEDAVYRTHREKLEAIAEAVEEAHAKGQPVLVGTVTIESSEEVSEYLKRRGIRDHKVLNAKFHELEAEIVRDAGKWGAVTIATNMAGRGTDIKLGGEPPEMPHKNSDTDPEWYEKALVEYQKAVEAHKEEVEKVKSAGGLLIIGTERHESRRIDNQLRGRSGRQGDPGRSKFYISLEDDLMRLFGSERMMSVFKTMGITDGQELHHRMLSNAIERAQKKIENNNFGIRKHLLEYDRVNNEQREIIYAERRRVLENNNMRESILKMLQDAVEGVVNRYIRDDMTPDEWNLEDIYRDLNSFVPIPYRPFTEEELNTLKRNKFLHSLKEQAVALYAEKEAQVPEEQFREIERVVLLKSVDKHWMEHIDAMDQLRQSIGLQAYAQRDPVVEYKFQGFDMFEEMTAAISEETIRRMFLVHVEVVQEREQVAKITGTNRDDTVVQGPKRRENKKIMPNDPCPCGSGRKFKQCCKGNGKYD